MNIKLPTKISVAGVSFYQSNLEKVRSRAWFTLVPEPDNWIDPNAIKVMAYGKFMVGYIPGEMAQSLAPMLENGQCHDFADFCYKNVSAKHTMQGLTIKLKRGAHYVES